jgi:CheY-like chemotaxis protein/anti-sigma regulatory factor (Ser/Thr protein kinase)
LIGGLLGQQDDWAVQYAADGVEALALMETKLPDLVVTDLQMPNMDGLQLVAAATERYPLVPVILVTSKGSEEIAVEALKQGAASYVPKRMLADSLVETLENVLMLSTQKRGRARLLDCLVRSHYAFELENDSSLIPSLVTYLQDESMRIGLCTESECTRIGVALDEALVNALVHGNLEIGSGLRDTDHKSYLQLVRERPKQPPYATRRIHVEANLSPKEGAFLVRDEGCGFNPSGLPDPTDPANLEQVGGRGVMLMRTFMDEVNYNEHGNQVLMIKRPSRCSGEHSSADDNGVGQPSHASEDD